MDDGLRTRRHRWLVLVALSAVIVGLAELLFLGFSKILPDFDFYW